MAAHTSYVIQLLAQADRATADPHSTKTKANHWWYRSANMEEGEPPNDSVEDNSDPEVYDVEETDEEESPEPQAMLDTGDLVVFNTHPTLKTGFSTICIGF